MLSFEQEAVGKGGGVCVLAGAERGVRWGTLLADLLLRRHVLSERADRLLIVLSDRRQAAVPVRPSAKVMFVSEQHVLQSPHSESGREKTVVFVYSLSEILLRDGLQSALRFIHALDSYCSSIFVVHSTLHTPRQLLEIKNACATVMVVTPNDGSMSEEIVMETHTIRKSAVSGKVVERKDLFKFDFGDVGSQTSFGQLQPIQNSRGTPATLAGDPSKAESIQVAPGSSQGEIVPSRGGYQSRLITFDSNDPEFDDDSDPDHDLDI